MNLKKGITLFALLPLLSLASCKSGGIPSSFKSIGEVYNLKDDYKGYKFDSSNSFVGRVRPDGVLETYRDGKFQLSGTKKGEDPIFIDCEVADTLNYPNFVLPGVNTKSDLSELRFIKGYATGEKIKVSISYEEYKDTDFIVELTNPSVGELSKDEFDSTYLTFGSKPGSTRIKIFLRKEDNTKGKLLLDYYCKVNSPIEPAEALEYFPGTSWTSLPVAGEQYYINFVDNTTGSFTGFSAGGSIVPINFTYTVDMEYVQAYDAERIHAKLVGTNGPLTLEEFFLSKTGNELVVLEHIGLSHIFYVDGD